jgi:hypothetical protein
LIGNTLVGCAGSQPVGVIDVQPPTRIDATEVSTLRSGTADPTDEPQPLNDQRFEAEPRHQRRRHDLANGWLRTAIHPAHGHV